MKYFFYAALLFSLTAQFVPAQNKMPIDSPSACLLTLEKSPVVRGLKLGMTVQEVEKSLGRKITPIPVASSFFKSFKTDIRAGYAGEWLKTKAPVGQSEYFFYPQTTEKNPPSSNRSGGFELAFIDDVLAEYIVYYSIKDFDFSKDKTISAVVAAKLNLPVEYRWTYGTNLNCQDFIISINNYGSEAIRLSVMDVNLLKEIRKRAEQAYAEAEKQKPR